ncbi:SWIM zinc finger family protein [Amycolatopsis sp. NBC_00438]|uniref:SWIM zinc finger family protein n=1 Tax=Amycolatopsis sp. NBC_00438 TaxID=2903558 RepID=UPI002E2292B9
MTEPLPWWPTRFIRALSAIGVLLPAKGQGRVVSLEVGAGRVDAEVQDSRLYRVRIGLTAFGKADWAAITHALAAQASATVQLLSGELPRDVEQIFKAVRLPLFPSSAREVSLDCTCPDVAVPCGHLNAVFAALVARVGDDPFTVLALRGRNREALLEELKNRLIAAEPLDPDDRSPALTEVVDTFFDCGPAPGLGGAAPLRGPRTPFDALLDQAPPFTITVGGEDVAELLRPVYRALAGEHGP